VAPPRSTSRVQDAEGDTLDQDIAALEAEILALRRDDIADLQDLICASEVNLREVERQLRRSRLTHLDQTQEATEKIGELEVALFVLGPTLPLCLQCGVCPQLTQSIKAL